mgnify:CR=1 FL=1
MKPIYFLPLAAADHRLLWWLIANADSKGQIRESWKVRAAKELGLHYVTVANATTKLREAGVIEQKKFQHGVKINKEAFAL